MEVEEWFWVLLGFLSSEVDTVRPVLGSQVMVVCGVGLTVRPVPEWQVMVRGVTRVGGGRVGLWVMMWGLCVGMLGLLWLSLKLGGVVRGADVWGVVVAGAV